MTTFLLIAVRKVMIFFSAVRPCLSNVLASLIHNGTYLTLFLTLTITLTLVTLTVTVTVTLTLLTIILDAVVNKAPTSQGQPPQR